MSPSRASVIKMFAAFVMAVYESLGCRQYEKMDLDITFPRWKEVKYAAIPRKAKNVQEDISEELWAD